MPVPAAPNRRNLLRLAIAAAALMLLIAAAVFLWGSRRTPAAELDGFWEPLFRDRNTIQICIGQPTRLYRFTGPRIEELN